MFIKVTLIGAASARALCILAGVFGLLVPAGLQAEVLVAAASSIRGPLNDFVAEFEEETGIEVRVSYGASGNLTHQILRGAPYEIFLSADRDYPGRLAAAGRVRRGPLVYAHGRLVIFAPHSSGVDARLGTDGIRQALRRSRLRHLAIADPYLAPYGRAARSSLMEAGLWDQLRGRMVVGRSVAGAAQLAASGSVDAAIISLSLALSPALTANGDHGLLPEDPREPLHHAMVLVDQAGVDAVRLFGRLCGSRARVIFKSGGFEVPSTETGCAAADLPVAGAQ